MEQNREKEKKQVPLRLSAQLYQELAKWAEDEFRSVNGQIEYLLHECVRRRKGGGKAGCEQIIGQ
jgi:hypothetical protein